MTAARTADLRVAPPPAGLVHRFAHSPHRFFFLIGVGQIAIVSLWWLWVLAARVWSLPAPGTAVPDTVMHALAMTCGFAPFFMFGFMFTAGPRWLNVAAPGPRTWFPPALVATAGALALVPLQVAGWEDAVRIAAGVYAIGWLWLVAIFGGLVRTGAAPEKVHAMIVFAALCVGAGCVAAFAAFGPAAHPWIAAAGVWGFLLPVFVAVCHRMIPFFTSSALPFVTAFRPWWLLVLMAGAPLAHALLAGAGLATWTWLVDLPSGAALLYVTLRWGLVQSFANRLLAMLHVGFVWYGLGFLLAGASSLLQLAGERGLGLAPLHALTIGFAATLLLAMVTRVTAGHSGRTLAADALTWRLFQVLQVAAVVRIGAEAAGSAIGLFAAVVLWAACFVPWCIKYAPVYWRARADGRPG